MITKTRVMREIPIEWDRMIELGKQIGTGKATITFNQGRPVMVEVIVKKINLDKDEDFQAKRKVIPMS